ncbi:hypothetical protein [Kitasatospora sp. NPDC059327]|uniref:hypothetical protein n=1 Tax=Kitasatospora sp. NPDC059327 TaxID=3346803 RepID=UPI0036B74C6C
MPCEIAHENVAEESDVTLRFLGIDPDTGTANSPTIWVDDQTGTIVLQGFTADDTMIAEALTAGHGPGHENIIPDHESVIHVPARMVPLLRKACDEAERSGLH